MLGVESYSRPEHLSLMKTMDLNQNTCKVNSIFPSMLLCISGDLTVSFHTAAKHAVIAAQTYYL